MIKAYAEGYNRIVNDILTSKRNNSQISKYQRISSFHSKIIVRKRKSISSKNLVFSNKNIFSAYYGGFYLNIKHFKIFLSSKKRLKKTKQIENNKNKK